MVNIPGDRIQKTDTQFTNAWVHSMYEPGRYCVKYWFCMCGRPITNHKEDVDRYEAALKVMALFVR